MEHPNFPHKINSSRPKTNPVPRRPRKQLSDHESPSAWIPQNPHVKQQEEDTPTTRRTPMMKTTNPDQSAELDRRHPNATINSFHDLTTAPRLGCCINKEERPRTPTQL